MTLSERGSAQVIPLRGTTRRTQKRRRVTASCVHCNRHFRYIYPGTGPYRSVCPTCKGE